MLANVLVAGTQPTPEEAIVLHQAGLILDLRSASERKEDLASTWMNLVGVTAADVVPGRQTVSAATDQRRVLRIDVLSPTRFFAYATEHWLNPTDKTFAGVYRLFDPNKLHELQMDALNNRGLAGLNEAILETGKAELCLALQQITLHLEQQHSPIVFHCVQGKDRTGLLSMLCQSILGLSDEDIVDDYFKSDVMRKDDTSPSAAAETVKQQRGKLNKRVMSGAPRHAMRETLTFVRGRYGSVAPGYLDAIGFDASWRLRFQGGMIQRTSKL
jgi:hypothetical protein